MLITTLNQLALIRMEGLRVAHSLSWESFVAWLIIILGVLGMLIWALSPVDRQGKQKGENRQMPPWNAERK